MEKMWYQLAEEGFLFCNAHSAAPTCSPSRAAMLTDRTAHEAGMLGLAHRGWGLKDLRQHLAHWLGEHGYHTVLSGVQHEWNGGGKGPYAEVIESEGRGVENRDIQTALDVASWMQHPKGDQPFFLWSGFFYPHRGFLPADPARFSGGSDAAARGIAR